MKRFSKIILTGIITGALLVSPVLNEVTFAETNKATTYVNQAINWAGALKWQLSVDYTKSIKLPDAKVFTNTKQNILNAKKELSKMKGAQKTNLEKKLHDQAEIHYDHAVAYIDAINSGKMLRDQVTKFDQSFKVSPVSDATEKAFNDLSYRINHTAKQLYKVYGNSTRQAILKEYKTPAENMRNAALDTITAKKAIDNYRNGVNIDKDAVLQLINKVSDPDTRMLLNYKLSTGNDAMPASSAKYKAEFEKLHYVFSSQTVATYPGKSVQIGLLNCGEFWQLTMKDWDQNYWDVTRRTIEVVWGDYISTGITKYVEAAIMTPGHMYKTPNFSTFVVDDTLVIHIYLPRN